VYHVIFIVNVETLPEIIEDSGAIFFELEMAR
jgi:hypothetical protein